MPPEKKKKTAPEKQPVPVEDFPPPETLPVPAAEDTPVIIGIGASAGGLEALESFFKKVPRKSGLAFVVIQHMDPTRKGMMAELLQHSTSLPVAEITDRLPIKADHVYIIPPNQDVSILHGVLHLLEPESPRGQRLPVDFFLRSLADDQRQRSIGVILSGMGSDGTLGLRAIKEKAGAVFVQSPEAAKFDGMPRSAIDAGLADIVAPAEELPAKIIAYLRHAPLLADRGDPTVEDQNRSSLEKIILLLRANTGHDFSLYKKNTLYRRIERRMGLHQLAKITEYVRYLRSNSQEVELLFKELLIGVTSFFRDPEAWEQLKDDVLPALLTSREDNSTLRAWIPACSTGEEAYSLAMVFREALEKAAPERHFTIQIFATDLDSDAIEKARFGVYPANIAGDVSEKRLDRFFVKGEHSYHVRKNIREMMTFAQQNLVMDPPFTKLDLLLCRNLLIYLEPELQQKLIPLFHYSLKPGGILMLGTSESTGRAKDLFASFPGKTRIYRRQKNSLTPGPIDFPTAFVQSRPALTADSPLPQSAPASPNLQTLADELVLRRFSPATVLTTHRGDIVYISARIGKYLEPTVGKANLNIFAMARQGLASALSDAFAQAVREKTAITLNNVQIEEDGNTMAVDVIVQHLSEPDGLQGMVLVVFRDVPGGTPAQARRKSRKDAAGNEQMEKLSRELQRSKHEAQAIREEMQTSQEELKSANEELQSTNEELQSSNEEMTTSREEMQSMNEELQTVNQELTAKVEQLSQASDDMKNLLESTEIATLFLDNELKVRRFTTKTVNLFKLIPGDAGRPITDLVSVLDYPDLTKDAREVRRSLVVCERQIPTHDGGWFSVRIMPYRTQDDKIDGLVITFIDISGLKALEATLLKALSVLQKQTASQTKEPDSHKELTEVLERVRDLLEKQFSGQPADRQTREGVSDEAG